MNLNKRIEPKENGDTDEPETPVSEFAESPRIPGVQINVQDIEVTTPLARSQSAMHKRESTSKLAEKRGLFIRDLGIDDERQN